MKWACSMWAHPVLFISDSKHLSFPPWPLLSLDSVDGISQWSEGGPVREYKSGLGGICKSSNLPSNISIASLIDGRSDGQVWTHRKLTRIIFLANITSNSSSVAISSNRYTWQWRWRIGGSHGRLSRWGRSRSGSSSGGSRMGWGSWFGERQ